MPISLTVSSETPEGLMADIRTLFPSALPPMQEQPKENREPLPAENVKEVVVTNTARPGDKAGSRTRSKKTEAAEGDKGEMTASADTQASDAPAYTASQTTSETAAGSTESQASGGETQPSVPDIEDLRARLKTLGATEGFGHDKVFEVLGKYGAKNASTVPEEKRADCIAEIDELLKAGK